MPYAEMTGTYAVSEHCPTVHISEIAKTFAIANILKQNSQKSIRPRQTKTRMCIKTPQK